MHKLRFLVFALTFWVAWPGLAGGPPRCITTVSQPVFAGGTNGVEALVAADINGDTYLDVVTASFGDDKVAWFENDQGSPPGFIEHVISTDSDSAVAIHAEDINGDGHVDVLVASADDNTVALFQSAGEDPDRHGHMGRKGFDGCEHWAAPLNVGPPGV